MTRSGERGFAALELSAGVALLVLPVALLVLALPQWASHQALARLAARDAARVVARAGWCDQAAGRRAVNRLAATADLAPGTLGLDLDCTASAPLPRAGVVTARVTVVMPALAVPVLGEAAAWRWTAGHREPVDPYGSRP
ncbi:MAG: hypothetical protein ACKOA9_12500 [Actinomycetota bacterium]